MLHHPWTNLSFRPQARSLHSRAVTDSAPTSNPASKESGSDSSSTEPKKSGNPGGRNVRIYGPLKPSDRRESVDFMILGHPRSGTGYMSQLFTSAGYHVGHEYVGEYGISCWTFATPNANHIYGRKNSIRYRSRQDFDYKFLIHNVREPRRALSSVYFSEHNDKSMATKFRRRHCDLIDPDHAALDQVVESYVGWNQMIEALGPDLTVRVEDCEQEVADFLVSNDYRFNGFEKAPTKDYNARPAWKEANPDGVTLEMLDGLLPENKRRLNAFCDQHGYERLVD